jgi:hypothetical protein
MMNLMVEFSLILVHRLAMLTQISDMSATNQLQNNKFFASLTQKSVGVDFCQAPLVQPKEQQLRCQAGDVPNV